MSDISYQENWAWVDKRLEELYYSYALTSENCSDYMEAGLLKEFWSKVDESLEKQFNAEFEDLILCPAPISWVSYKNYEEQRCLEDESQGYRERAESDISDHSEEVERALNKLSDDARLKQDDMYKHIWAIADERESLVSSNWDMEWEYDCYTDDCSELSSEMMDCYDGDGYDSF